MSRVGQLLTLAGIMLLALGAAPRKPAKPLPKPITPAQTVWGQITQVNPGADKLTLAAHSTTPGVVKTTSQTFAISNSTLVTQGKAVTAKELRSGDKVIVNYSAPPSVIRRAPYGNYPHLNAYGEVTKTSPLTVKVIGGLDLVITGSGQIGLQRERKLGTKDLKQGWLVSVMIRKEGGREVADQVRVLSTMTLVSPPAVKPKPKPKAKP